MKSLESNAKLKKREVAEVGGEVLGLIEDPRKRSYTPSADGEWASRRSMSGLYPIAQLWGSAFFFWSYVEYKLKLAGWA